MKDTGNFIVPEEGELIICELPSGMREEYDPVKSCVVKSWSSGMRTIHVVKDLSIPIKNVLSIISKPENE